MSRQSRIEYPGAGYPLLPRLQRDESYQELGGSACGYDAHGDCAGHHRSAVLWNGGVSGEEPDGKQRTLNIERRTSNENTESAAASEDCSFVG